MSDDTWPKEFGGLVNLQRASARIAELESKLQECQKACFDGLAAMGQQDAAMVDLRAKLHQLGLVAEGERVNRILAERKLDQREQNWLAARKVYEQTIVDGNVETVSLRSRLESTALKANDQIDQLTASNLELQSRLAAIVHKADGFCTEGCECGRCAAWREAKRIATGGVVETSTYIVNLPDTMNLTGVVERQEFK